MNPLTDSLLPLLPAPHADLWTGITFGATDSWPWDLSTAFLRTGTIHMVAVSGMNLTLLTSLTGRLLLPAVGKYPTLISNIVISTGYIYLVGLSPSVVRAALMSFLTALAVLSGRNRSSIWVLILTVLLMIAADRYIIGDISFQLSVLATSGIVLLAKREYEYQHIGYLIASNRYKMSATKQTPPKLITDIKVMSRSLMRFLLSELRVTLAAQAFTVPIILIVFHRVSIIAPLANVLVSWTMPILLGLGLVTSLVALLSEPLALPLAWVAYALLSYVIAVVEYLARFSWASLGF